MNCIYNVEFLRNEKSFYLHVVIVVVSWVLRATVFVVLLLKLNNVSKG